MIKGIGIGIEIGEIWDGGNGDRVNDDGKDGDGMGM